MLAFDEQKCLAELRHADTADLLDRVTAYRAGLEPRAIALIEQELHDRGVTAEEIDAANTTSQRECLFDATGIALPCSRCWRPAVAVIWRWHKLWGVLPLFPWRLRCCRDHIV
jgi:hypothetical protein